MAGSIQSQSQSQSTQSKSEPKKIEPLQEAVVSFESTPSITETQIPEDPESKPSANDIYCDPNPINIRFWKWLDWLCFVLLLLLGMCAIGMIAANGTLLHNYDYPFSLVNPRPGRHLVLRILAAAVLLLIGSIFGHIFLHFLRNMLGFCLTVLFILVAALMLLYLVFYLTYIIVDTQAMIQYVYDNVLDQISNIGFKYNFFAFQADFECCGVRSYTDWKIFNPIASLDTRSLPRSCLRDSMTSKNFTWGALLAMERNSAQLDKVIHRQACSSLLLAYYEHMYVRYLFDLSLITVFIILCLIPVVILFCRWYRTTKTTLRSGGGKNRSTIRPEEDGLSNDPTTAQTPMTTKSTITNNNGAFFAP